MSDTPRTDAALDMAAFPQSLLGPVLDLARELERENARLRGTLRAMWNASPPPARGWPPEYRRAWDEACKDAESFFLANREVRNPGQPCEQPKGK